MIRKIFLTVGLLLALIMPLRAEAVERIGVADIEVRLSETLINVAGDRVYKTFPGAAHIIVDDLAKGLLDSADVIDLLASTEEERLNELIALGQAAELKTLECDYIVHGFLINVSRSSGDKVVTKNDTVTVEISARVLDVKKNQCVFVTVGRGISSATQFRIGPLIKFGHAEFYEGQLNDAMKQAAHQIADNIVKNF